LDSPESNQPKFRDSRHLRVSFSLKKEIFFITIGSMIGAFTMFIPRFVLDATIGTQFYLVWLIFAKIVGSSSFEVGIALHLGVGTVIGIINGIILYKAKILNISKIRNGLIYGVLSGVVVFVVFFLPVQQLLIAPNMAQVLVDLDPDMTLIEANESMNENFIPGLIDAFFTHIIWGITLGLLASILTRRLGANYRCHICDIEFPKISTYHEHFQYVHDSPSPSVKEILILGGGYGGTGVLNHIQKKFENNVNVSISLVSESNFFLHTPMLPEMATGTIEPRHIATPIRNFCKRARFYQAKVVDINLNDKTVTIQRKSDKQQKDLSYDYLVLALGGKTNFFGNQNVEKHAFTIKSLGDAIKIRNQLISMLEDADQESDSELQSKFVTFVVVGGGFSGVETIGELNSFVRESAEKFYRNIPPEKIKIILVAAGEKILPEIGDLGKYAKKSLKKAGVTIHVNTRLEDAGKDYAILNDGTRISCSTLIWAGGNTVDDSISQLDTEHHKSGRLILDEYMRLKDHPEVYALGDCAEILDPRTNTAYPPTAQHAIRESKTLSENLINAVKGSKSQKPFIYDTKGSMAKIGKRDGVALMFGYEFKGIIAWFIWKQYYLSTLPTTEKRIRVGLDWFVDLFFPRDITRLTDIA